MSLRRIKYLRQPEPVLAQISRLDLAQPRT
jgi:hypothetical protein